MNENSTENRSFYLFSFGNFSAFQKQNNKTRRFHLLYHHRAILYILKPKAQSNFYTKSLSFFMVFFSFFVAKRNWESCWESIWFNNSYRKWSISIHWNADFRSFYIFVNLSELVTLPNAWPNSNVQELYVHI